MNLMKLFKLLIVSHLKREKSSVLITLISIMLGVGIYVAIRLLSINILIGFDASTNYLSNNNIIITSKDSISETIIPELLNIPGVDSIIPVSTRYVPAYIGGQNIGSVQIVGLDILSINHFIAKNDDYKTQDLTNYLAFFQNQPIRGLVSRQLSDAVELSLQVLIDGEYIPITPSGVVNTAAFGSNEVMMMDIRNFQDIFKDYNTINQLYLTFNTLNVKQTMSDLAAHLPPSLQLSQGNDNAQYAEEIASIYRFNLNFLICLALLVTAIIVYNAISYYLIERRRDFGIMLMLGAQPGRLFLLSMMTSFIMAVVCSFGGLAIGYIIVWLNIKFVVQAFSSLLLPVSVSTVVFPISLVIEVMSITLTMALLVSIFPCLGIYRIPARQTISYQTYEEHFQTKIPSFNLLGTGLIVASLFALLPSVTRWQPVTVYFALCGLLLGMSFFLPTMIKCFLTYLRVFMPTAWIEARMAIDHIKITLRKNVTAIAAMSIAITLYMSSMILIDSTRYTCISWLNQISSADVYINTKSSSFLFTGKYIPKQVTDFVVARPDVSAVNLLIHKDTVYENKPLRIIGMDFSTVGTWYKIPFIQSTNIHSPESTLLNPGVFISEHVAHQFNYHIGDTIPITGNHGVIQAKIANIFYNYASFENILLMPNALFKQLYDDPRIESALIYLKNPKDSQAVLNSLQNAFPEEHLFIQNQTDVTNTGVNMMEQTFKISKAIISAIFLLTALTLFNILEQLILSRRHEFTVFWSLGAADAQLIKMCLWESLVIYISAILSSVIPTITGLVLIFNFLTKRLFGIELMSFVSYQSIFIFLIILTLLIILGGLIPAFKIRQFINTKGLRDE